MKTIIVHTLEHVTAALTAGATCLQSAPGAIHYAGTLYLLHMFKAAMKRAPDAHAIFIVDCADDAAEAINAMQMGHKHIRSSEPRIEDIAKQYGVTVYTDTCESLDLLESKDVRKDCINWLQRN